LAVLNLFPTAPAQLGKSSSAVWRESTDSRWAVGLILALSAGVFLRLFWPNDIEFKNDQLWLFMLTQQAGRSVPWPWLGLPSSAQILPPGLSVWTYIGMARAAGVKSPVGLAFAVKVLNSVAIILLVGFAQRFVAADEREFWLWAAAFQAINPVCVWLERKIWQPSIFPIFTLMILAVWWGRERPWPAFAWGVVGALLGQVQGSGFFFAGGLVLWAWLFDRRRVAWRAWLAGSIVGLLPMIPWMIYMWREGIGGLVPHSAWSNVLNPRFYTAWFSIPFGVNLHDPLGPDFYPFLRYPLVNGVPTYGVSLLHLALLGLGCWMLMCGVIRLWKEADNLPALIVGRGSATAFTQQAALIGFGGLITLSGLPGHIHYMIVVYPLIFVWLARLALNDTGRCATVMSGRQKLVILCVLEFLLSLMFLVFIHQNHGAPGGDFGAICQKCNIQSEIRPVRS
jgi:hypothetical protein